MLQSKRTSVRWLSTNGKSQTEALEALEAMRRDQEKIMLENLKKSEVELGSLIAPIEPNEILVVLPGHEVPTQVLERKVEELTARLAIEKEYPPYLEDSETQFKEWHAKIMAKNSDAIQKKSSRAMWRRNKKIAAVVLWNETQKRLAGYKRKARIHELETTLNAFKYHMARMQKDGHGKDETLRLIADERARLDSEGGKLAAEKEEVDVAVQARTRARARRKDERRERETAKKEKERIALDGAHVSASKDLTVDARVGHLRDISQSIQSMKTLAEKAQLLEASKLTVEKVEDMLRQIENETSGATTRMAGQYPKAESDAHDAVGVKDRVPDVNPSIIQMSTPDNNPNPARVSGESNQPTPLPDWPTPQTDPSTRTLTQQLRAQLSSRGQVKIDNSLTVDAEADVSSLQTQIQQLSEKLKKEFPMMDTLPYDVWTSEKRKTLQTWLKILVWKWQTRYDSGKDNVSNSPRPTEGVSLDVRALLEQNVLEHGLDKQAAARMVKRWAHIFERKEDRKTGVELEDIDDTKEELDWDQMDAGLGWLRNEWEEVDEERQHAKATPEYEHPPDLPFSWKTNRGKEYKSGASHLVGRALARSYHTTAGKRTYSTSTRLLNKPGSISFSDSELMRLVQNAQNQSGSGPNIEEADNPAEDPFSNGEIADLLAAVSQSSPNEAPVSKAPETFRTSRATVNEPTPPTETPAPTSTPIPHEQKSLPHLTSTGTAHMVSVSSKPHTTRTAIATGTVYFSNATPLTLIRSAQNKKGDVLSVSRIAAIMAAKQTPTLIPLCHPIMLTHVGVELHVFDEGFGGVVVESRVQCEGQTGVEMEALTSVMGGALSVVDMCKAVDKGIRIEEVRVVLKEGGRSGTWREEGWRSKGEE